MKIEIVLTEVITPTPDQEKAQKHFLLCVENFVKHFKVLPPLETEFNFDDTSDDNDINGELTNIELEETGVRLFIDLL